MTTIENPIPPGWQAHGRHRVPATLIGGAIRRGSAVHYVVSSANPGTTAALIATIAVGTASRAADARLSPKPWDSAPRGVSALLGPLWPLSRILL